MQTIYLVLMCLSVVLMNAYAAYIPIVPVSYSFGGSGRSQMFGLGTVGGNSGMITPMVYLLMIIFAIRLLFGGDTGLLARKEHIHPRHTDPAYRRKSGSVHNHRVPSVEGIPLEPWDWEHLLFEDRFKVFDK